MVNQRSKLFIEKDNLPPMKLNGFMTESTNNKYNSTTNSTATEQKLLSSKRDQYSQLRSSMDNSSLPTGINRGYMRPASASFSVTPAVANKTATSSAFFGLSNRQVGMNSKIRDSPNSVATPSLSMTLPSSRLSQLQQHYTDGSQQNSNNESSGSSNKLHISTTAQALNELFQIQHTQSEEGSNGQSSDSQPNSQMNSPSERSNLSLSQEVTALATIKPVNLHSTQHQRVPQKRVSFSQQLVHFSSFGSGNYNNKQATSTNIRQLHFPSDYQDMAMAAAIAANNVLNGGDRGDPRVTSTESRKSALKTNSSYPVCDPALVSSSGSARTGMHTKQGQQTSLSFGRSVHSPVHSALIEIRTLQNTMQNTVIPYHPPTDSALPTTQGGGGADKDRTVEIQTKIDKANSMKSDRSTYYSNNSTNPRKPLPSGGKILSGSDFAAEVAVGANQQNWVHARTLNTLPYQQGTQQSGDKKDLLSTAAGRIEAAIDSAQKSITFPSRRKSHSDSSSNLNFPSSSMSATQRAGYTDSSESVVGGKAGSLLSQQVPGIRASRIIDTPQLMMRKRITNATVTADHNSGALGVGAGTSSSSSDGSEGNNNLSGQTDLSSSGTTNSTFSSQGSEQSGGLDRVGAVVTLPSKCVSVSTLFCRVPTALHFWVDRLECGLTLPFEPRPVSLVLHYGVMTNVNVVGNKLRFKVARRSLPAKLQEPLAEKSETSYSRLSSEGGAGANSSALVMLELASMANVAMLREKVIPLIQQCRQ